MAASYSSNNNDSTHLEQTISSQQRLRSQLAPLPAAKKEVKMLAETFEGYFGIDSLATESNFKQRANQYGIIHLAMHGRLNEKFPTLSSLIFTEDTSANENNLLQAYEISRLELNADLVVLSACQTGYGKFEKGNGVASLARAFTYAGVPSLVVTLWQIDDYATSVIMKDFYLELSKGKTKANSLRLAKRNFLQKAHGILAHPVYWSSFILIGDSKPIQVAAKRAHLDWNSTVLLTFMAIGIMAYAFRIKFVN